MKLIYKTFKANSKAQYELKSNLLFLFIQEIIVSTAGDSRGYIGKRRYDEKDVATPVLRGAKRHSFHGFELTCKNIFSNLRVLRALRGVK